MHVFSRKVTYLGVLFLFLVAGGFFWLHPSYAQTALETVGTSSGLPTDNIAILIARIIRVVLSILGIIAVILVIYGGWLFMTSEGKPEKNKKAIDILKNTAISLMIILISYSIVSFILDRLIDAAGLGGVSSIAAQYSEPLSGSLGGGIIEDHYPARNATDIPRNTKIMVTFKESMDPASFLDEYCEGCSSDLKAENVLIYRTILGETDALTSDEVSVSYDADQKIFVFDPVDLLGSADEDTNYTVVLEKDILKADGTKAFTGVYGDGYAWTFEVSTEVDLTPPTVTHVVPPVTSPLASYDRNISIEVTFSEAMDPIATTGTYSNAVGSLEYFNNAAVYKSDESQVEGTFAIGNNYRTIVFTTPLECGKDPCGDEIYCLPELETITVAAHAATLGTEPPGALMTAGAYDGLVDSCGNSLDGDADGTAIGSDEDTVKKMEGEIEITNDDYTWSFKTTDKVNNTVPEISSLDPNLGEDEASNLDEVEIVFSMPMKTTTLTNSSISLWPDPIYIEDVFYEMWFSVHSTDSLTATTAFINHSTFVSNADGGWDYYPVVTNDVKSYYQICLYPAYGPSKTEGALDGCKAGIGNDREQSGEGVYCCDGVRFEDPCVTDSQGETLPYTY